MIEAVLLDFYGTVVHEDDVVIDQICTTISRSASGAPPPIEVGRYWWSVFSAAFEQSHGSGFRLQRDIEIESLVRTVEHFSADCDAEELSGPLFDHWERPPIFDDALAFLASIDLPIVVVSNTDRRDIEEAIAHHELIFDEILTSEDVRSYKPRSELFVAALNAAGVSAERALHVGDSVTSDVAGAAKLGIPVVWVNRKEKPSPMGTMPTYEVSDLVSLQTAILAE